MKNKKKRNRLFHRTLSVRWKLAIYMSFFVAIVLMVTWFFQVFLLNTFFRSIKKDEMEDTAAVLSGKVGTDILESAALTEAIDHSLCVLVYRLDEQGASCILSRDADGSNFNIPLSEKRLADFYRRAKENGGICSAEIAFGDVEIESDHFLENLPLPPSFDNDKIPTKNIRLLYVALSNDADGNEYMIILETAIHPLDSTVQTLVKQYGWIAAIILIVAAIMVVLLYRKITDPLIRMNESAKQLALGKYDVEFSGQGYLETRELAATLNYASHELSRLDRLQKELIANISHDLRTPLTMIQGYGEIMRDLPGENTPENMQVLIDETARLTELVNDLLDLSKIQSGTRMPNITPFDLTVAVEEVMLRYDTLIKHKGYRVIFEKDRNAFVSADRNMILQVLYNLINNAINYTGEDQTVTVLQTVQNGRVRISVKDTGEGIAPDEMPLIWDRYYKVDKVHKRATIGTGLGLSIVKSILELHHAAYGVSSTLGQGSVFWFELPLGESFEIDNKKEI